MVDKITALTLEYDAEQKLTYFDKIKVSHIYSFHRETIYVPSCLSNCVKYVHSVIEIPLLAETRHRTIYALNNIPKADKCSIVVNKLFRSYMYNIVTYICYNQNTF